MEAIQISNLATKKRGSVPICECFDMGQIILNSETLIMTGIIYRWKSLNCTYCELLVLQYLYNVHSFISTYQMKTVHT